jgi:hypothetical protein
MILDQNATITFESTMFRTVLCNKNEVNDGIEGSSFIIESAVSYPKLIEMKIFNFSTKKLLVTLIISVLNFFRIKNVFS